MVVAGHWQPVLEVSSGSAVIWAKDSPSQTSPSQWHRGREIGECGCFVQCKPPVMGDLRSGALCQAPGDSQSCTSAACYSHQSPQCKGESKQEQGKASDYNSGLTLSLKAFPIPAYFLLYVS